MGFEKKVELYFQLPRLREELRQESLCIPDGLIINEHKGFLIIPECKSGISEEKDAEPRIRHQVNVEDWRVFFTASSIIPVPMVARTIQYSVAKVYINVLSTVPPFCMTVNSLISTYTELNNAIIHGNATSVDVYFQPFSAMANLKRENQ